MKIIAICVNEGFCKNYLKEWEVKAEEGYYSGDLICIECGSKMVVGKEE